MRRGARAMSDRSVDCELDRCRFKSLCTGSDALDDSWKLEARWSRWYRDGVVWWWYSRRRASGSWAGPKVPHLHPVIPRQIKTPINAERRTPREDGIHSLTSTINLDPPRLHSTTSPFLIRIQKPVSVCQGNPSCVPIINNDIGHLATPTSRYLCIACNTPNLSRSARLVTTSSDA